MFQMQLVLHDFFDIVHGGPAAVVIVAAPQSRSDGLVRCPIILILRVSQSKRGYIKICIIIY